MRGKFRSRSIESILAEVEMLAEQGVKEVCLIAQDSTNYGTGFVRTFMLPALLDRVSEIRRH